MTAPFRTLSYELTGFPYERARALLRKRSTPKNIARATLFTFIFTLVQLLWMILPRAGFFIEDAVPLGLFLIGIVGLAFLNQSIIRLGFENLDSSPHGSGNNTLNMDATGVSISGQRRYGHYPWSYILDTIEGPDGTVMILVNPYEYEPVPAKAFSNPTEQLSFIAAAKAHRANAQKMP